MRPTLVFSLVSLSASIALALAACGGGGGDIGGGGGGGGTTNNNPVVASANADMTLYTGVNYNYETTKGGTVFTDPDGDTLAYSMQILPAGSGIAIVNTTIFGVPTTAGTYTVILNASDGKGGLATDSFTITVEGPAVTAATHPVPTLPVGGFKYADADISLPFYYTQNNLPAAYGNVLQTDNTPVGNPTTNIGATLGRILFYDKRLSINDTIACASCHLQSNGFAEPRTVSVGFAGGTTSRNSPALANSRYYQPGRAFLDESAASLEELALIPIQNPIEMGMDLAILVPKLQATSFYPSLFQAAYGSSTVTTDGIARAIAQFLRSMSSYNTKFDEALRTGNATNPPVFGAVLSTLEDTGRELFQGAPRTGQPSLNCSTCHGTAAVVANMVRNNGLDVFNPFDDGAGGSRFKVPSLRNIALTAPYMHDGRFATLRDVLNHYSTGIQAHNQLDNLLKDGQGNPQRFNLTNAEMDALEAFLGTLTDPVMRTDPKFANPFP